jgi:hypothetical protein
MLRVFLLIVLGGALLLWLNPPDPERLERWGLDLSAFFPKGTQPGGSGALHQRVPQRAWPPAVDAQPGAECRGTGARAGHEDAPLFRAPEPRHRRGARRGDRGGRVCGQGVGREHRQGNWRSDRALVQGWIDSPGHRANILNPEVREIGVGLLRDGGIAAGRPLARLYAVQLFGKPLSDCGELPSDRDRAAIEEVDGRLELLNARLRDRRRELDDLQARIDRASSNTERNRWIQEPQPARGGVQPTGGGGQGGAGHPFRDDRHLQRQAGRLQRLRRRHLNRGTSVWASIQLFTRPFAALSVKALPLRRSVPFPPTFSPCRTICEPFGEARGVGFRSLSESIDTTTSGGRLIFHVFGALGQFERDLIRDRTRAGLAAAAARGRKGGRKPVVTPEKLQRAKEHIANGLNVREAAARVKVGKTALYDALQAASPADS